MKKYLAVLYEDSRMGSAPSYQLLDESRVKDLKLYGEFVKLYELATPQPLDKHQARQLGLRYASWDRSPKKQPSRERNNN